MQKYKKYIIFQYNEFSPKGGYYDITDSFDSIEECILFIKSNEYKTQFNKIVDRDSWEVIFEHDYIRDFNKDQYAKDKIQMGVSYGLSTRI